MLEFSAGATKESGYIRSSDGAKVESCPPSAMIERRGASASSSFPLRPCLPITFRTATGWWRSASSRSWAGAGTSSTWPPGASTCAGACPETCTCTGWASTAAECALHAARRAACIAGWRRGGFDLVHQLNPVDVGVSLALRGPRACRSCWARTCPTGPPRALARTLRRAPPPCAPSGSCAPLQQRRATTAAALDPGGRVEGRAGARRARVHELPIGDRRPGLAPARHRAAGQDVLFLANLEVRKGIHVLLDAFARIAPDLPEARLLHGGRRARAGRGPRGRVERVARARPRRAARPGRARAGAAASCRAATSTACPPTASRTASTALEAMACARPVVVTAAGGLGAPGARRGRSQGARRATPARCAEALRELLADPAAAPLDGRAQPRRGGAALLRGRGWWTGWRSATRRPSPARVARARARFGLRPRPELVGQRLAGDEPEDDAGAPVERVAGRAAAR